MFLLLMSRLAISGPVYTGPDKFCQGQKLARFHLAFTRDRLNWTNFFTVKCASLGPRLKSRSTFWPVRFRFRTDSCKHPNRATFCSDSTVEAWNLIMFLPGCRDWTHVNTTTTEFARIHVNSRSGNKILPYKNLSGPGLNGASKWKEILNLLAKSWIYYQALEFSLRLKSTRWTTQLGDFISLKKAKLC